MCPSLGGRFIAKVQQNAGRDVKYALHQLRIGSDGPDAVEKRINDLLGSYKGLLGVLERLHALVEDQIDRKTAEVVKDMLLEKEEELFPAQTDSISSSVATKQKLREIVTAGLRNADVNETDIESLGDGFEKLQMIA